MSEESQHKNLKQVLTFKAGSYTYAFDILKVKEIIEYDQITPIPLVPEFILGVRNLRGQVVPVIDLKSRFALGAIEISKLSCIIIIEMLNTENSTIEIGVAVDAVSEVIDVNPEMVEEAPDFGSKIRADFVQNVVAINEQLVLILQIDKVFALDEIAVLEEIAIGDEAQTPA